MKRLIAVSTVLAIGMMIGACNKGGDSGGAAGSSSGASASGGGAGSSIGVKECDDYIAKWQSCYKDPTMKAAAEPAFKTMRDAWAQQAKDPNSKAALATGCKAALDQLASNPACK